MGRRSMEKVEQTSHKKDDEGTAERDKRKSVYRGTLKRRDGNLELTIGKTLKNRTKDPNAENEANGEAETKVKALQHGYRGRGRGRGRRRRAAIIGEQRK